jgi:hypothetical protein
MSYVQDYNEYLTDYITSTSVLQRLMPDYLNPGTKHGSYYVAKDLSKITTCPATRKGTAAPSWNSSYPWFEQYFSCYAGTVTINRLSVGDRSPYRQWGGWRFARYNNDWSAALIPKKITQVTDNSVILIEKGYQQSCWNTNLVKESALPASAMGPLDESSPAWWNHDQAANFLFLAGNVTTFKYGAANFNISEDRGWSVD